MYYFDNNLCCLCLTYKKNYTFKDNYDSKMHQEYNYFLTDLILQEPQVSKQICKTCMKQLNNINKFRKKCLKNMYTFNEYVRKLKQENRSYRYLSVDLSKTSHIQNNTNVKEEIFTNDNYNSIGESPSETKYLENVEQIAIMAENAPHNIRMADENFVKEGLSYFYENNLPESFQNNQGFLFYSENNLPGLLSNQTNITLEETTKIEQEAVDNFSMDIVEDQTVKDEDNLLSNKNDSNSTINPENQDGLKNLKINEEKQTKCNICHEIFVDESTLKIHRETHNKEQVYKCQTCKKIFKSRDLFEKHAFAPNCVKSSQRCDVCNESFNPLLTNHKCLQTYRCDLCKQIFADSHSLKIHKNSHDKIYACDVCSRTYVLKHLLIKHKLTHNKIIKFNCNVCQKSFNRYDNLAVHKRTHTDVKLNPC